MGNLQVVQRYAQALSGSNGTSPLSNQSNSGPGWSFSSAMEPSLKRDTFGVDPQSDFKWNMQPDHPARIAAEQNGYRGAQRADALTRFIAQLLINILVSVHIDRRAPGKRRSAFDLYRHALKDVLAGWTHELESDAGRGSDGTHTLVLDSPPIPRENRHDARFWYLTRQEMVAFDLHQRVYRSGVDFGWTQLAPLRRLGAASAPSTSHANQNLALQIAGCVVGCVTGFIEANVEWATAHLGTPLPPLVDDRSVPNLLPRCRAVEGRVGGYGIRCFPPRPADALLQAKIDALCPPP